MSQQIAPNSPDSPRPLFQYSLFTLFVVVTAAAFACAVFLALPVEVGVIASICVVITTPAMLTVVLIYGRGYARTYCIGALFPAGFYLFPYTTFYGIDVLDDIVGGDRRVGVLLFMGLCGFLVFTNGVLAVYIRRQLEAPGRSAAEESDESTVTR